MSEDIESLANEVNQKEKTDKFLSFLKASAVLAVISGVFGASFQKGMILTMGIGNFAGNYDVREIFNSAIIGYLYLYTNFSFSGLIDWIFNTSILKVALGIVLFGCIVGLFNQHKAKIKNNLANQLTQDNLEKFQRSPFLFSTYLLSVYALVLALMPVVIMIMLLGCFVLILPAYVGFTTGVNFVNEAKKIGSCVTAEKSRTIHGFSHQCGQIVLRGKIFTGEVLLENNFAYFIHHKHAFLYISKDGSTCIYSAYTKIDQNGEKQIDTATTKFDDKEILKLCGSEHSQQWKGVKKERKN